MMWGVAGRCGRRMMEKRKDSQRFFEIYLERKKLSTPTSLHTHLLFEVQKQYTL